MVKAFVFGKFLPFHKGHEAMIRFALAHCDQLTVLICCSDQETISGERRTSWIANTFGDEPRILIQVYYYKESDLPNTSVSSREVSRLWAAVFRQLLPEASLLITSEPYGDYVAEYMHMRHLAFDLPRQFYPVSATAIRCDRFANWHFLPESVQQDLAIKIVLTGTESTGKTTLAEQLSTHFNCGLVTEAGRDLIENSQSFVFEDLHRVAAEHARRIAAAIVEHPVIIIDTDIHITLSYARFFFERDFPVDEHMYSLNRAHLYLYLNNDVPFFQDGTRLEEQERNLLDQSHRRVLKEHTIDWVEITGNWKVRFEKAVLCIEHFMTQQQVVICQHGS